MSKGLGQKIAIKFTEDLVGLETTPAEGYAELMINTGTATASNSYSSSYSPDKAFDGSTSTYWRTNYTPPQWIQIQLAKPIAVHKFRWYVSSYAPKDFVLQGSNDGENWGDIYTGESPSASGWKEFIFKPKGRYGFYRWNITSRHSSYIYIYEIELYYKEWKNELAFDVIGKEYKHIDGALIDGDYRIARLDSHPTEAKTILLTFEDLYRFNNVEGNLTINYDATKGNLMGAGGAVESFSETFLPTDLVPVPNPHAGEIFISIAAIDAAFTRIYYTSAYGEERFTATARCITDFIYVGVINP